MKEKPYPLIIAVAIHAILLLCLANILIVKPSVRKILFDAKLISSKDVGRPTERQKHDAVVSKKGITQIKELIT
ncbi:MAG: hypothetical protein KAU12_01050, partial [Candidatus Omnitrophica bacterium]|nr:hypothetical protein [Candidatus Omnitrophota bacterium]